MSPTQELLAVAVVLYLVECLALVPRSALVFRSLGGIRFRIREASRFPRAATKALMLRTPLPPLGAIYEAYFCRISMSPDGVSNRPVQHLDPAVVEQVDEQFIPMAGIHEVSTSGNMLCMNGADFADCGNKDMAEDLGRLIEDVAGAPREARASRLEAAISQGLDTRRSARAVEETAAAVRDLRYACNVLFIYLFVCCPLMVWFRGLRGTWLMLLIALLALWFLALFEFVRAHRRLFPKRARERRRQCLMLGVTPISTIRACDALTRHALAQHHPLAISSALCEPRTHREFAKRIYADLSYPVGTNSETRSAGAYATESWFREKLRRCTEVMLRESAVDPFTLLTPPVPTDETCRSYCPRCEMLYELVNGECPHCPGVSLQELDGRNNVLRDAAKPRNSSERVAKVESENGFAEP